MEIGVLGLGNWGTALANHLAALGHDVLGWSIEEAVVSSINTIHHNVNYLSDVELHPAVRATTNLPDVCHRKFLVLVLPSAVLHLVLPDVTLTPDTILLSCIKGLNEHDRLTPLQCAERYMPIQPQLAVISGPSFAKDLVIRKPLGLVVASKSEPVVRQAAELFTSNWTKIYMSNDPLGVELGGILKNVIAIAAGVSDGLSLGDSARAGLVTRGLAEMMRLAKALGAEVQTLSGLSGLGDLVLTATCNTSRNRTVGLRLGRGESLEQIIDSLGSVAEGVKTAPVVLALAEECGVEMPITEGVNRLLSGSITAQQMAEHLISRPSKQEFYNL